MKMKWTVVAMLVAGVPAAAAAQQPTADSAKQGTAPGREVNQVNESGDTTRSALRDSLLRNGTNTNAPTTQSGASTTEGMNSSSAAAREGAATGQAGGAADMRQTLDSAQAMQGAESGRPVLRANESGDTTQSALRARLLRESVSEGPSGAAAAGSSSGMSMNLSRAQTRQLQEALNGAGCDAGGVDGVVGPRTRAAITCAREKNNITGDDNQALFRALGLSF